MKGKKEKKKKRKEKVLDPEILAGESLAKLPIGRDDVPGSGGATVTGCDPKGK